MRISLCAIVGYMMFLGQGAAYLVAPHQPYQMARAAMTRIRTPRRNAAMRVARMLAAEPDVVEDARVARLIKSHLIDLVRTPVLRCTDRCTPPGLRNMACRYLLEVSWW